MARKLRREMSLPEVLLWVQLQLHPGGYAFREPLTVVTDKGSPQWTTQVRGIINDMKADGTLRTLTTKWYGRDYSG